jgi:Fur family ferric uptake transcriptional regulator
MSFSETDIKKVDVMHTQQEIVEYLKHLGERITMPRRAVIQALCELGGHQTTQSIEQHLDAQGISVPEPTVYRVLQWLKDLALVSQTDLGHSGTVYELLSTPPHHHLICLICGHVQNLDDSALTPLRSHLQEAYGFEPRIDHMAIFGVCQKCQEHEVERDHAHGEHE